MGNDPRRGGGGGMGYLTNILVYESPWGFNLKLWPCLGRERNSKIPLSLGQHPQFYNPFKGKGQNARRRIGKCITANSRYSHFLCIVQNWCSKWNQSCKQYPVDRLSRNYIPSLGQRGQKPYAASGTSPYRPYEGEPLPTLPPPLPEGQQLITVKLCIK